MHTRTEIAIMGRDNRVLIEYCCGPDSVLGQVTRASRGCKVVRLTEKDNMATRSGLATAMKAVHAAPKGRALLWASIPCTGGCSWQYVNTHRNMLMNNADGIMKLVDHWVLFRKLWRTFAIVARAVHKSGGFIAIEWPRGCIYWEYREVKALVRELDLTSAEFDGCCYDLRTPDGMLIKKPWLIKTNCKVLADGLRRRCNGNHQHGECRG